jgi:hypothetical protein
VVVVLGAVDAAHHALYIGARETFKETLRRSFERVIPKEIRSLKVGNKVVGSVKASVTPARGGLLLGQSFLERFKSWSIDNTKHELLLNE